jgi:DNA-binding NtrC family response regulator
MALHLLLVDDNPVLREFVREAVDSLDLEITESESADHALSLFRASAADVVIVDLNLAGGSTAWPLIEEVCSTEAFRSRVIVYSGTIGQDTRARLVALGVSRMIVKPSTMDELHEHVAEILGTAVNGAPKPAQTTIEAVALERFGGNERLYQRFRSSTCAQLRNDIVVIDSAVAAEDWGTPGAIAHSLKSALALLGDDASAAVAAAIEHAVERGDVPAARINWSALRPALMALTAAA